MNKLEHLFNFCMEEAITEEDFFINKVGTWVDKFEGIDFFYNGMAIDVTHKNKSQDTLLAIKTFNFSHGVTGFMKYCNGHITEDNKRQELSMYVMVLKFDLMTSEEMIEFGKTMPEVMDAYYDAQDEYEAHHIHMVKKPVPMSYFNGPCPTHFKF